MHQLMALRKGTGRLTGPGEERFSIDYHRHISVFSAAHNWQRLDALISAKIHPTDHMSMAFVYSWNAARALSCDDDTMHQAAHTA